MDRNLTAAAVAAAAEKDNRREMLFYTAKLNYLTGRLDDMMASLHDAAQLGTGFTKEERDALSMSWHLVIQEKRKAWKRVVEFQKELHNNPSSAAHNAAEEFRIKLEKDVIRTFYTVIEMIRDYLIPSCATPDVTVALYEMITTCFVSMAATIDDFLKPMTGQRYAFGSAVYLRQQRREVVKKALESQELALEMAEENLCPTSPIRLSTALKTSDLYEKYLKRKDLYDLLDDYKERAYQVVEEAIEAAESKLKSCTGGKPKNESKGTEKCMVLLREKLTHLKSVKEKQHSAGILADAETTADIDLSDSEEECYKAARYILP